MELWAILMIGSVTNPTMCSAFGATQLIVLAAVFIFDFKFKKPERKDV